MSWFSRLWNSVRCKGVGYQQYGKVELGQRTRNMVVSVVPPLVAAGGIGYGVVYFSKDIDRNWKESISSTRFTLDVILNLYASGCLLWGSYNTYCWWGEMRENCRNYSRGLLCESISNTPKFVVNSVLPVVCGLLLIWTITAPHYTNKLHKPVDLNVGM